ncbi:hypothetical protein SRABI106_04175 [Rahnella aquatilis]|nr:hypothetical protein SRABI106_04175 [Rahnella aquatilis]
MHIFALEMTKLNADIGFIRRFIFAEPAVALRAHQAAPHFFRDGSQSRRNGNNLWLHLLDKAQRGRSQRILVFVLISLKPVPGVVLREFIQKLQTGCAKNCPCRNRRFRCLSRHYR